MVLGVTFKENVPDIRNSKIFDLIHYFVDFGHSVKVCDPMLKEINIDYPVFNNLEDIKDRDFDVLVMAVNHKSFKKIFPKKISKYLKSNAFIADIKGMWRNRKHNFRYWSL